MIIQQLMTGQKKVSSPIPSTLLQFFREPDVRYVRNIPAYEELSAKQLYREAIKNETIRSYLPDCPGTGRGFCDREFLYK